MRMTSKGQVTVPQELRQKYGLGPKQEVKWLAGKEGPILVQAGKKPRGHGIIDRMQRGWLKNVTTDEILKLTRE